MFLGEFMLGTLAFIFREHLAKSLKAELLYGIEKHYNVTREPGTLPAIWDHIHTEVRTDKCHFSRGIKLSIKCLAVSIKCQKLVRFESKFLNL